MLPIRCAVMDVRCGCMQNATKFQVTFLRFVCYTWYMIYGYILFCQHKKLTMRLLVFLTCDWRILEALIIIVLLAKPSLILSYLIQRNLNQKSSKWIMFYILSHLLSLKGLTYTFIVKFWWSVSKLMRFNLSHLSEYFHLRRWNKHSEQAGQLVLPNKVTVLCNGVEGIYFPSLHL